LDSPDVFFGAGNQDTAGIFAEQQELGREAARSQFDACADAVPNALELISVLEKTTPRRRALE
jgi:hypothetical protein